MRLQLPGQQQDPGGVALPRHLWVGGKCLISSACAAQGAASPGLEKIPEPIKEATAQFYGERGARLGWDTPAMAGWSLLQGGQLLSHPLLSVSPTGRVLHVWFSMLGMVCPSAGSCQGVQRAHARPGSVLSW